MVWPWRLLIILEFIDFVKRWKNLKGMSTKRLTQLKIAFHLDWYLLTCPSKHLPMLSCFECGVCSLFQLQAWTDLDKQTKPNLQPNVLEA